MNSILFMKPISHIFNSSISWSVLPDKLKIAIIIPIRKKKDKLNAENYRSSSLISNVTRIYEKIIKSNQQKFLESNNLQIQLIPFFFFKFAKTRHRPDTITKVVETIHTALDDSKIVLQ